MTNASINTYPTNGLSYLCSYPTIDQCFLTPILLMAYPTIDQCYLRPILLMAYPS